MPMLRAADYQPPDDDARKQAEAAEGGIAAAIAAALQWLHDNVDIATLAALLAGGSLLKLNEIVGIVLLPDKLQPAMNKLTALHDSVAAEAALQAGGATYDTLDASAVAAQQAERAALVGRMVASAEQTVQAVVSAGLADALPPQEIAAEVKATAGLTDRMAAAIANYRRMLEQGDAAALDRVLRDRRFDGSVQRAIDGATLDPAKIDRMVDRYAERYRAYRARVIARTEALRAANAGRRASWVRYAGLKRLQDGAVRRRWLTAADERVCLSCRMVPLMNPDGVELGSLYETPDGPVDMPPLHPSCRCTETYSADSSRTNAAISFLSL